MPKQPPIRTDGDILLCPKCDGTYVHLNVAYVAGRAREDGPVTTVQVNNAGRVVEDGLSAPVEAPARHAISVAGFCENCTSQFAIGFVQHKGQTFVQVVEQTWKPIA